VFRQGNNLVEFNEDGEPFSNALSKAGWGYDKEIISHQPTFCPSRWVMAFQPFQSSS
jgi:hypothetical protein